MATRGSDRRGHLDRLRLARDDDGELRARPVLARRCAPRGHRSSGRAGGDRGYVLDVPYADGALRCRGGRRQRQVFANLAPAAPQHALAADGVSCTVCHQIAAERLGEHASFDGGFTIAAPGDGPRRFRAPRGRRGPAGCDALGGEFTPSAGTHIQRSELCATCHTLYTTALDDAGAAHRHVARASAVSRVAAQRLSRYASCQSCHMPEVAGERRSLPCSAQPRPQRLATHVPRRQRVHARHAQQVSRRARRDGLAARARAAAAETRRFLGTRAASLTIATAQRTAVGLELALESRARPGTSCRRPIRRAARGCTWSSRDAAGRMSSNRAPMRPDGSIAGNDNDADARALRAALRRSSRRRPGADLRGDHGRFARCRDDGLAARRSLREGQPALAARFDKATAEPDFAVQGAAAGDADFVGGGDRVRYRIALGAGGPPADRRSGAALSIDRLSVGREPARLRRPRKRSASASYYAESAAASAAPHRDRDGDRSGSLTGRDRFSAAAPSNGSSTLSAQGGSTCVRSSVVDRIALLVRGALSRVQLRRPRSSRSRAASSGSTSGRPGAYRAGARSLDELDASQVRAGRAADHRGQLRQGPRACRRLSGRGARGVRAALRSRWRARQGVRCAGDAELVPLDADGNVLASHFGFKTADTADYERAIEAALDAFARSQLINVFRRHCERNE